MPSPVNLGALNPYPRYVESRGYICRLEYDIPRHHQYSFTYSELINDGPASMREASLPLITGTLMFPPKSMEGPMTLTFHSRGLEDALDCFETTVEWLLTTYDETYRGVSIS